MEKSPNSLSQHNNNKHNMVVFSKTLEKYDEIQIAKIKCTLTIKKWKIIHSPLPYLSKLTKLKTVTVFSCDIG